MPSTSTFHDSDWPTAQPDVESDIWNDSASDVDAEAADTTAST